MNAPLHTNRTASEGARSNILIRIAVGGVFLNEGLLKFLDPMANAAGRFAAIGIPAPQFFAPWVATVETGCGLLVGLGLLSMVHEARTDFSMWLGLLFLLLAGPGRWSLDAVRRRQKHSPE